MTNSTAAVGHVFLLVGKVACGKTTYARQQIANGKAILLSLDELQLAIYGAAPTREQLDQSDKGCRNYQQQLALKLLTMGANVYIDWGFWSYAERKEARAFFIQKGFTVTVVYFDIDLEERRLRNAKRNASADTASFKIEEKDMAMFDAMFEPPTADEYDLVIIG